MYNYELIKETPIITNEDKEYCDEYNFLIGCKTDNTFYILNALYHERIYDDYEPYYSKFELKPFETEIIINEDNINKYKYVKEEIEEFLYTRKKKLNINEVEIKFKFNPFFYNEKILKYFKYITFEEACMYDLSVDEEGEMRLIEGDSGLIYIKKGNYNATFRFAEQCMNYNRRELNIEENIIDNEFDTFNCELCDILFDNTFEGFNHAIFDNTFNIEISSDTIHKLPDYNLTTIIFIENEYNNIEYITKTIKEMKKILKNYKVNSKIKLSNFDFDNIKYNFNEDDLLFSKNEGQFYYFHIEISKL